MADRVGLGRLGRDVEELERSGGDDQAEASSGEKSEDEVEVTVAPVPSDKGEPPYLEPPKEIEAREARKAEKATRRKAQAEAVARQRAKADKADKARRKHTPAMNKQKSDKVNNSLRWCSIAASIFKPS